jgi:hypothetical protein
MNLSRPCFALQALRLSKKKSSALVRSVAEKGGRPDRPYIHPARMPRDMSTNISPHMQNSIMACNTKLQELLCTRIAESLKV